MSRRTLAPFMYELRETTDTALYRFGELEIAASTWLSLDARSEQLLRPEPSTTEEEEFTTVLQGTGEQQRAMFEALEAFLAAWARVSLIIWPTRGNKQRGRELRVALHLTNLAILEDRELRDSWMHFDERLDAAVSAGGWGNRHKWVRSSLANIASIRALRLFEVDTLAIRIKDRNGSVHRTNLHACKEALLEIQANWQAAFGRLSNEELKPAATPSSLVE